MEFDEKGETKYPAVIRVWKQAWEQVISFLAQPTATRGLLELRNTLYTTNAIGSLNARFCHAVNRRGQFPTKQAAMTVLYPCVKRRGKHRPNPTGKMNRWGKGLNALAITFGTRITNGTK